MAAAVDGLPNDEGGGGGEAAAIDAGGSTRKPLSFWPGMYHSPVTNALWVARSSIFERKMTSGPPAPRPGRRRSCSPRRLRGAGPPSSTSSPPLTSSGSSTGTPGTRCASASCSVQNTACVNPRVPLLPSCLPVSPRRLLHAGNQDALLQVDVLLPHRRRRSMAVRCPAAPAPSQSQHPPGAGEDPCCCFMIWFNTQELSYMYIHGDVNV